MAARRTREGTDSPSDEWLRQIEEEKQRRENEKREKTEIRDTVPPPRPDRGQGGTED